MPNIAVQRLHSHQIANSTLKTPDEVVSYLGGMQAQDYIGAKWSIGVRCGKTEAEIEGAIADKTIIRSWVMRGTLQFVVPADLRWMLALLMPKIITGMKRRYNELELDGQTLTRSVDLFVKALENEPQTRSSLREMLETNGISASGQRNVHMLQYASMHGLICQGVMKGNDPTFMLIDDSVPQSRMSREASLAELARRYFTTRAPATLQDFVWWSGLNIGDARIGIDAIRAEIVEETIDGKTYYLPQSMKWANENEKSVYLLPGFDEYLISYRDRSASLDPAHANDIVPGGNGMFRSTLVVDGRVMGVWTRTKRKKATLIGFEPFYPLPDVETLKPALQQYEKYLETPVEFA